MVLYRKNREVNADAFILTFHFIKNRLADDEIHWAECPVLPLSTWPPCAAMKELVWKLEHENPTDLWRMSLSFSMTKSTTYFDFVRFIKNELFSDGVTWEKIVKLFAFGGLLASKTILENESLIYVGNVAMHIALFLENELDDWIQCNGGYQHLVKYNDRPNNVIRLFKRCSIM